jgi:hypothetical protein
MFRVFSPSVHPTGATLSGGERALTFRPHENRPDKASIGALARASSVAQLDVYEGSHCGRHHRGSGRHKPRNPVGAVEIVDVRAVWILFVAIEENGSRKRSRHYDQVRRPTRDSREVSDPGPV